MSHSKQTVDVIAGRTASGLLKAIRLIDADFISNAGGWFLRKIGPHLREHRIAYENLVAAFPEKSDADIERILNGTWDNLGRTSAEFAHLDRLRFREPESTEPADVTYTPEAFARIKQLENDGKPALIFAAHLANWELPAITAFKAGLDAASLFRKPNVAGVADAIIDIRAGNMGMLIPSGPSAPFAITKALEQGKHVGMLVDQYYGRGVDVMFFGRRCKTNPLLAKLARHVECPIHGTRVTRLGGRKFRVDLTEAIKPARDVEGKIDVESTMQMITTIIEGWVREHPDQWLWQHRRWR